MLSNQTLRYDYGMKAPLAFVLLCAASLFSQQDPSSCTPTSLGPFAFGGVATLKTDGYVYPRYFRYAKQWDQCIARGKWPASTVAEFREPFPSGLSAEQRKIVTREAYDWDVVPQEAVLTPGESGFEGPMRPRQVTSWAQYLEVQQKQQEADRSYEIEKLVDARLVKLRSRLGASAFAAFDAHVHELLHATPARLVPWQWPESLLFVRYLSTIATMDKFSANAGEDGTAAANARADEQRVCGLSNADEETLQRVADDYQKDIPDGPIMATVSRSADSGKLVASAVGVNMSERANSHIQQLKQDLSEASFEKIEKCVHAFPPVDHRMRIVPKLAAGTQPESSGDEH
jgi:hypothetical protein